MFILAEKYQHTIKTLRTILYAPVYIADGQGSSV